MEIAPILPKISFPAVYQKWFYYTLLLEVFTQSNFVAEFIRFKSIFIHKNDKFAL